MTTLSSAALQCAEVGTFRLEAPPEITSWNVRRCGRNALVPPSGPWGIVYAERRERLYREASVGSSQSDHAGALSLTPRVQTSHSSSS